jgi:hypothetical protein
MTAGECMTVLSSIRVLIALDGLAADLLERRLLRETDFDLVARTTAARALAEAQRVQPDFIVVPLAGDRRLDAAELLEAVPRMKVLALELVGGRAFLTELVDDVAPDELIEALRRAAVRRDE